MADRIEIDGRVTRVADCYDERVGDTTELVVAPFIDGEVTVTGISDKRIGELFGRRVRIVIEVIE